MFGLFAKKAAMDDDGGHMNGAGGAIMVPIKIGGHEFMPDDSGVKAYDAWVAKAKANNELIQLGDTSHHVPINSDLGKVELVKADLQLHHGLDPVAAEKAVKAAGLEGAPVKPIIIFKSKAPQADDIASQAAPAKGKASAAADPAPKAQFRGPRGPVMPK